MREYIVEQTSLNVRLTFDRMLPMLPGPGTPAFAGLIKGLQSYGISPSGIILDGSTSNLGDMALFIPLLERRVGIRFTFEYFELFVRELLEGDDPSLIAIGNSAIEALREIDVDSNRGSTLVRTSSHLKLSPSEASIFLQEHLRLFESNPILIPDAAANKIDLQDTHAQGIRVVVAESLAFEDSIFIDLSREYKGVIIPKQLAEWGNVDFERVCELMGLREKTTSQDRESHD